MRRSTECKQVVLHPEGCDLCRVHVGLTLQKCVYGPHGHTQLAPLSGALCLAGPAAEGRGNVHGDA
jgi:hypothetical protein